MKRAVIGRAIAGVVVGVLIAAFGGAEDFGGAEAPPYTAVVHAQAPAIADARNLSGAWEPMRGGRGTDPRLLPPPPGPIVLNSEYSSLWRAKRAAQDEAAKNGVSLATLGSQCVPYGMPTMMAVASYPVEIIQTPGQVTLIGEAFSEVRRVYMDRPQLKLEEVPPGYYGRSIGSWDGDTLVIDTVGIATTVAGYQSLPHSNQLRITERIRLVTQDVLHDQITLTDPIVLTMPVTYTLAYRRLPKYEMVEFVCDNNREYVDDKGVIHMKLPEK
jgi:hypothetical protein